MACAASGSGSSPAMRSSRKTPCPSWRPAVTLPTQPRTALASQASTSAVVVSQSCFSSTPCT